MPERSPARILIVDDEAPQMEALCQTLRDQGYHTTGFANAQTALAAVTPGAFDLLIADLMMPDLNGIRMLQLMRAVDPSLVGVIMTGEGSIDSAVEAMKAGALDYILKPFRLSVILPVLSRALSVRELRLENQKLERQVLERTAELEAANRELEAYTTSVSHDLRAPLRHVLGFIGFALESIGDRIPPGARQDLDSAMGAARKMDELISDLLDYSKAGRSELKKVVLDLNELVAEVVREFAPDLRTRRVDWEIGSLPPVLGDRVLMRQVFFNLIGNALKFTRTRATAKVEIGSRAKSGTASVFVRDNGVGFDMKMADRLFGTFQRLHSSDQFEGNGIGLANVQRIIVRHGGRVWAESRPGEGAVFGFDLPVVAA